MGRDSRSQFAPGLRSPGSRIYNRPAEGRCATSVRPLATESPPAGRSENQQAFPETKTNSKPQIRGLLFENRPSLTNGKPYF